MQKCRTFTSAGVGFLALGQVLLLLTDQLTWEVGETLATTGLFFVLQHQVLLVLRDHALVVLFRLRDHFFVLLFQLPFNQLCLC
jgi:hypothetical protein